jgi:hypothetical protein
MNTHAGKREQLAQALLVLWCIGAGALVPLTRVLKKLDLIDFIGNLTYFRRST